MKYVTDSRFRMVKTWDPTLIRPKRDLRLFAQVPSDAPTDTVLQIVSGEGTDTLTTAYIAEREVAWVESMGILVTLSSTPNVSWNAGKKVWYEVKYYSDPDGDTVTVYSYVGGASSSVENWYRIVSLSESINYDKTFKVSQKDIYKFDFVALSNFHYWTVNLTGDEYVKLVAEAGAFTYSSDAVYLYLQGLVLDYDYIRGVV